MAYDRFNRRMAGNRHFAQLNRLTTRHGALVVLVIRLVNLFPFALVNYGFGLTKVRFGTYVLWSFLGKVPGTVVLVVGVEAIFQALLQQRVPWKPLILVASLAVVLALVIRKMHHWLQESAQTRDVCEEPANDQPDDDQTPPTG